jgi:hypothetical protein
MDELDVGARPALGERHFERVENERGAHVAGELPADDPAVVDVDDEGEEHDPFPAAAIGEVRDPELVRAARAELPVNQIGAPARGEIGACRAPRLAAPLRAADPVGAHQPLHRATSDGLARQAQRFPHSS